MLHRGCAALGLWCLTFAVGLASLVPGAVFGIAGVRLVPQIHVWRHEMQNFRGHESVSVDADTRLFSAVHLCHTPGANDDSVVKKSFDHIVATGSPVSHVRFAGGQVNRLTFN